MSDGRDRVSIPKEPEPQYLGDGLYASFDGFQIVLKANSNTDPTDTVYLEPSVFRNLVRYAGTLGIK